MGGSRLAALLVLLGGCAVGAVRSDPAPVASQAPIGPNACGPCAVLNGLLWGDAALRAVPPLIPGGSLREKVEALVARYGSRPSEAYGPERRRYEEDSGTTWVDLTHFVNDLLADHGLEPVSGAYLDREEGESPQAFVRRIHGTYRGSLRRGMPVITSIRSFAPAAEEDGKGYVWKGLVGHWVAVVSVQERLREGEKGFSFEYVDSATGRLEYGYVFYDEARNFTAARGDAREWTWVTDRPFLLVRSPSLRLGTQDQPWSLRTIITLNYAVFRADE